MTDLIATKLEQASAMIAQLRRSEEQLVSTRLGELVLGEKEYALLPKDCFNHLEELLGENGARIVLYDLGKVMGQSEAKAFFQKHSVGDDPVLRLLLRPFVYMARGLGTVDILLFEFEPEDPSSLVVVYEDARPVAPYLVAGFSAGWKSEAIGVTLDARPIPMNNAAALRIVVAERTRLISLLEDERLKAPKEDFTCFPIRLP